MPETHSVYEDGPPLRGDAPFRWLINGVVFLAGLKSILPWFRKAAQETGVSATESAGSAEPSGAADAALRYESVFPLLGVGGVLFVAGLVVLGVWVYRVADGRSTFFPDGEALRLDPGAGAGRSVRWGLAPIVGAVGVVFLVLVWGGVALRASAWAGSMDQPIWGVSLFFFAETVGILYALGWVRGSGNRLEDAGLHAWRWGADALGAAVAWLAFVPIYMGVGFAGLVLYLLLQKLSGGEIDRDGLGPVVDLLQSGGGSLIFIIVAAVIVAPVLEEILFRGVLYGGLRQHLALVPASLICGALFGAVHLNPLGFLPLAALGTFLCLLRERSGGLSAPIAAHAVNNVVAIGFQLLLLHG